MFKLFKYLFKDFFIFSAEYSNDVFPDPLSKDEKINVIKIQHSPVGNLCIN